MLALLARGLRLFGGGAVVAGIAMLLASARGYGDLNPFTVIVLLVLGGPLLLAGRSLSRRASR